jgi:hypothetical protein
MRRREGGKSHLSKFLRNDQVALPNSTPFLRVPGLPTCRLRPKTDSLANLQVKEPSLVLDAPGVGEGDRKSTDFEKPASLLIVEWNI